MNSSCICSAVGATGYRPVIIMHGLLQSNEAMETLKKMITDAHPGTPVHVIDAFNDLVRTLTPLTSLDKYESLHHCLIG